VETGDKAKRYLWDIEKQISICGKSVNKILDKLLIN